MGRKKGLQLTATMRLLPNSLKVQPKPQTKKEKERRGLRPKFITGKFNVKKTEIK